jgi:hypothetical protein
MTIIDAAGTGWAVTAHRTLPATISHLRQVLGDEEFEVLTAPRTAVEPTEMNAYALEQIAHARVLA